MTYSLTHSFAVLSLSLCPSLSPNPPSTMSLSLSLLPSSSYLLFFPSLSTGTKVPPVAEFTKVLSEASQQAEDMMAAEAMDTDTTAPVHVLPVPAVHHSTTTSPPHLFRPNPKSQRSKSSTLVPQIKEEFSTAHSSSPSPHAAAKAANKKIPRYTVTKFRVKQSGNVMINGMPCPPSILKPSAKHPHISIDDSSLLAPPSFSKNMYNRRCSLPHNMKPAIAFTDDQKAEATLHQLAEHMHSTPPHLEPPSYAAIKQALLCDQYKRRQSMQTDPKTLKNLLQTKLVISDKNEIVSLRRKSDPGSYLKQRDFERRKELFMDENRSWSQAYGKVIDRKIAKWERKRVERMHREMLMRQFGAAGGEHGQLKFQFFNTLAAQQGLINPLSATNGIQPGAATSTLLAPSYLAAAAAGQTPGGIGANPFIFSQPVIAPTPPTTTAAGAATIAPGGSSSMFYSPFLAPYTFVNPYAPTLQVTNALGQPTAATYFIPQQQASPQKVLYFVPSTNAATVSPAPTGVPVSVANLPQSSTSILASTLSSNSPSSTPSLTGSPSPSIITQPPPPPHHIISTTSSTSPESSLSLSSNAPPNTSAPSSQQAPGSVSLANFPQLSSLMAPVSRTGHRSSLHSISSSSSSLSKDMSDETESYEYRPVSPGSRKRHQSVPEKLTSLLQQHSPLRGHVSPVSHDEYEEDEPVTPPSVKKQRSTSDTTVLYPPYSSRFSQLSPPNTGSVSGGVGGGGLLGGHLSKSKSTSPQPQEHRGGSLTAFQSHLLKVHQVQHSGSGNSGGGSVGGSGTERHRRIGVHSPNAMNSSSSGGPGGSGGSTSHYSNYIIRENSPHEIDEREVEDIVGGAIRSSGQQDNQGETKCPLILRLVIPPSVCLSIYM